MKGVAFNRKNSMYEVRIYAGSFLSEYDAIVRANAVIEAVNTVAKKKVRTPEMEGLYYDKEGKRWRVCKKIGGKRVYIGSGKTQEEARALYVAHCEESDNDC
jgi:hypothetical protein